MTGMGGTPLPKGTLSYLLVVLVRPFFNTSLLKQSLDCRVSAFSPHLFFEFRVF